MKIAFRLSKLGFGGTERVFISIADELSKSQNAVIHFVVDKTGEGGTEEVVRSKGFHLIDLSSRRTAHSIVPLKRYLESHKPDVLISAYTDTNMAALISCQIARHKCIAIVTEHAALDEHWSQASLKRRLTLELFVRFGYRFADHVLSVSRGIADQIKTRLKSSQRISYIYNPVRSFAQNVGTSPENEINKVQYKTILSVGRIAQQKDYLTLLKALNRLVATTPVRLIIVGAVHESTEKRKLEEYIHKNQLDQYVEFVGFTEDLGKFYRAADVFVLSSAWEGFGNVIVEALAFGLPVVSTNCNHGPSEILSAGRYGTLVKVGDAEELANAIVASLVSDNISKEERRNRALDFSEKKIAALYWKLIKELNASKGKVIN